MYLQYIEMDMDTRNTSNECFKRYDAVLFKGAVYINLFPETKIKPFE